ncbi:MAG: hypothetical protein GYB66_04400 [Chloroflexi bacterium]|nr:hypothetical protein [Chloroflexota bacterium]
MSQPETIDFGKGSHARVVQVEPDSDPAQALAQVGITDYKAAIVMHSGAAFMIERYQRKLARIFTEGLARFADDNGLLLADGGTAAGGMKLIGQSRAAIEARFPLVGVAVAALVTYPGGPAPDENRWPLDPHHSHFILVDGHDFGDESPLLVGLTSARAVPALALIVNGGDLVRREAEVQARRGIPLVVLKGSGRFADELAESKPSSPLRAHYPPDAVLRVFDTTAEPPQALYELLAEMCNS